VNEKELKRWYTKQDEFSRELYTYWLDITKADALPGADRLQPANDAVKLTERHRDRFRAALRRIG
jgi:hypothetical protein